LPLASTCQQRKHPHSAQRSLRISGLDAGSTVRPAPGQNSVTVQVRAVGSLEPITWLLDGRTVGHSRAGQPHLALTLSQPGPHALTALDAQGRFERVEFVMR
jgi:penicillin-binding protein 1C